VKVHVFVNNSLVKSIARVVKLYTQHSSFHVTPNVN